MLNFVATAVDIYVILQHNVPQNIAVIELIGPMNILIIPNILILICVILSVIL